MSDETRQAWMPAVEFDSDELDFARGVEVGIVWIVLKGYVATTKPVAPVTMTVHASNSEMMLRIAEAFDLEFEGELVDDDWTVITFKKKVTWRL